MKRIALSVFVVLVVTSLCSGQWLESVLPLPDSFGGLNGPDNVLYIPSSNAAYVSGAGGNVVVLDCATGGKIARLAASGGVGAMSFWPAGSKVYAASRVLRQLWVFDAVSRQVRATIPVPMQPRAMCLNQVTGKLYVVGMTDDPLIAVVDCALDSLVDTIRVATNMVALACNPTANKLYCTIGSTGNLVVVDCAGDSVLKTIRLHAEAFSTLLYNPLSNRVFCPDYGFSEVAVIDAAGDSLLRWIPVGTGPSAMCLDTRDNKVYVADWYSGELDVLGGAGDASLGYLTVGTDPSALVYDSLDNRLCCAVSGNGRLVAVDCVADSVVGTVLTGRNPSSLCYSPMSGRVFVANTGSDDVVAVSVPQNQVVAQAQFWFNPSALVYAVASNKLYCAGSEQDAVLEFDGASHALLSRIPVARGPSGLLYAASENKLYCACTGGDTMVVSVIDCARDSVVATIPIGFDLLSYCYNSRDHKVYYSDGDGGALVVIDAIGDTVISTVTGFTYPTELGYNYLDDKVYCGDYGDGNVFIIDGAADTVIVRLFVVNQPMAFCFVPASDVMCCAISGSMEAVTVIDGRYNTVRATTQVGDGPVAMTYNSIRNRLYTANNSGGSVTALDGNSWNVVATIPTGQRPAAIGFDSIADKVYCLDDADRSVAVIDARLDSVIETIGVGPNPSAMAWSPAHRRFYVASRDSSCISVLKDTAVVGIADQPRGLQTRAQATVVRGVLFLPEARGERKEARSALLDVSGRKVLDLKPGDNDVRRLPAGVYFVRQVAGKATTKVVVER